MRRGRAIIMYKHISTRILQTGRMIALFEIYIIQYKILKIKIKIWYSHKRSRSSFFLTIYPTQAVTEVYLKRCLRLKMIVWWTQSKNRIASCLRGGCFAVIIIITWTINGDGVGVRGGVGGDEDTKTICFYSLWSMFLLENLALRSFSLITK